MKYILYSIFGERFIAFLIGVSLIEIVIMLSILLIWLIHELITDFRMRPFNRRGLKK